MKKIKQLFVLLFLAILCLPLYGGCVQNKSQPLPPPKESDKRSTAELKVKVDELLASGDDVMIRRSVDDIFELVDRLVGSEKEDEALHYLSPALQHNSWAFDYQLLYARLLQDRGKTEIPRQTAKLVLQYAEQDEQINIARQLLHQKPVPKPMPMKPISSDAVTIVLIPIGEPDVCVIKDLRRRLAKGLGISVLLKDASVSVPGYKRDPVERALVKLRERLRTIIEQDPRVKALLKQNGITSESLEQNSKVVDAYRRLVFSSGGTDALFEFDAEMARLRKAEKQWDIDDIKNNLRAAVKPFLRNNVYFLGITDMDVFAGESNFLFYLADSPGHFAVTSYHRFTADFNQDTPNRKRLVERALKSSLACVGFMLGVPRCSTPTCPRTYPHNLQELDATSQLCDACRRGFKEALGGMPDSGISIKAEYENARQIDSVDIYDAFLSNYPNSCWRNSAIYYRDRAALNKAKEIGTSQAFQDFLDKYPKSDWADQARYLKKYDVRE